MTATYLSDHTYFSDEEREKLLRERAWIYYILYRGGLQETAGMFWETWSIYYKQRISNSYRIVRL